MATGIEIELSITDRGTAKLTGFEKTVNKVFNNVDSTAKRTGKDMESAFNRATHSATSDIESLGSKFGRAAGTIRTHWLAIGAAVAAVSGAIYGVTRVVGGFISAGGQMEGFATQLETIEGSAANAQKTLKELIRFAATTPFEIPELIQVQIMLKSVGITGKDTLRIVGDTAGAMGKNIQDVALALVSMETEVLRRLGIQLKREGKEAVFTWATAQGEIKNIAVENSDAIIRKTLLAIWNERYQGGMDKLAGTWTGVLSNMSDAAGRFNAAVGGALLPAFKSIVKEGITPLIENMENWVEKNKETVTRIADDLKEGVLSALKEIEQNMPQLLQIALKISAAGVKAGSGVLQTISFLAGELRKTTDETKWTSAAWETLGDAWTLASRVGGASVVSSIQLITGLLQGGGKNLDAYRDSVKAVELAFAEAFETKNYQKLAADLAAIDAAIGEQKKSAETIKGVNEAIDEYGKVLQQEVDAQKQWLDTLTVEAPIAELAQQMEIMGENLTAAFEGKQSSFDEFVGNLDKIIDKNKEVADSFRFELPELKAVDTIKKMITDLGQALSAVSGTAREETISGFFAKLANSSKLSGDALEKFKQSAGALEAQIFAVTGKTVDLVKMFGEVPAKADANVTALDKLWDSYWKGNESIGALLEGINKLNSVEMTPKLGGGIDEWVDSVLSGSSAAVDLTDKLRQQQPVVDELSNSYGTMAERVSQIGTAATFSLERLEQFIKGTKEADLLNEFLVRQGPAAMSASVAASMINPRLAGYRKSVEETIAWGERLLRSQRAPDVRGNVSGQVNASPVNLNFTVNGNMVGEGGFRQFVRDSIIPELRQLSSRSGININIR